MGFDYFACTCDTIEPVVIKRVVPAAWAAFQQAVAQVATAFNRSADAVLIDLGREEERGDENYDCEDADYGMVMCEQVKPALDTLHHAFTAATGGIELWIGWASDTFRGSDLHDEVYWYISGHQQPTAAYQAFAATHGKAITKTWISGG